MERKVVTGITLTLLFVGMLTLAFDIQQVKSEPATWTVDDDGPADFSSIQEAINAANPGDTILVSSGTYGEQPNIAKDGLTLQGEDPLTTIIDLYPRPYAGGVDLSGDNVIITGFTVQFGHSAAGIEIASGATGNTITGNIFKLNEHAGIHLVGASGNYIKNNNITNNADAGIWISGPPWGSHPSDENIIENNTITNNGMATIRGPGILFFARERAQAGSNNIIRENTFQNNNGDGIEIRNGTNNFIYHNNFFDESATTDLSQNIWDDGYPSGGNFWSDHNSPDVFSGPNQDIPGSDGIGDVPYIIDENNTDRYPLIYPYGYVSSPDVNDDEIVNIKDIVICALAFGNKPGDPNWNPQADIYPDGRIDIFDLVTIAVNYGKTW